MKDKNLWLESDLKLLLELAGQFTIDEIARRFGRSRSGVKSYAKENGISLARKRPAQASERPALTYERRASSPAALSFGLARFRVGRELRDDSKLRAQLS